MKFQQAVPFLLATVAVAYDVSAEETSSGVLRGSSTTRNSGVVGDKKKRRRLALPSSFYEFWISLGYDIDPPTPAPVQDPTPAPIQDPTPAPVPAPTLPPTPVSAPTTQIRVESLDVNGNKCGMSTSGTVIFHGGIFNYDDPLSDELGRAFVEEMKTLDNRVLDPLVILPGARRDITAEEVIVFENQWKDIMFPSVPFTVMHPNETQPDDTTVDDAAEADTIEFTKPLEDAMGVFLPGGRQYRFMDSYKYTRTEEELWNVLDRGGVIAGTSAGGAVMGDIMPRGDPSGSSVLLANREWYQHGFGFVSNIAIDNHVQRRGREMDMYDVLNDRPENRKVLGIGLNENTMIVVKGNYFQVKGDSETASTVRIYDCSQINALETCNYDNAPYLTLTVGDWYNLCDRRQVSQAPSLNDEEEEGNKLVKGVYTRPWSFGNDFKAGNPSNFICSGRKCTFISNPILIDYNDGFLVQLSGKVFAVGSEFDDSDRISVRYKLVDEQNWNTVFATGRSAGTISPNGQSIVNSFPAPQGVIQIEIVAETGNEGGAEFRLVDLRIT